MISNDTNTNIRTMSNNNNNIPQVLAKANKASKMASAVPEVAAEVAPEGYYHPTPPNDALQDFWKTLWHVDVYKDHGNDYNADITTDRIVGFSYNQNRQCSFYVYGKYNTYDPDSTSSSYCLDGTKAIETGCNYTK